MSAFPTIVSSGVRSDRLTTGVHQVAGRQDGDPVVFVHGNISSSTFFFAAMQQLADDAPGCRPIAMDLRGFGSTDPLPVDATRGLQDFADDIWATIDALQLDRVHLVGWSMGGGIVQQMTIDTPARVLSLTLVNPVSPFGFGGTRGADGRLNSPDAAGSGGGTANPAFVAALDAGDAGADAAFSPRSVLRAFYVAPGWDGVGEDQYVASMLSTAIGPDSYPGDATTSDAWPGMAPGRRGVLNTMAPTVLDLSMLVDVEPRPPVLWIRGEADQIVSDTSMFDFAQLGVLGAVPGYPGVEVAPPQPMWAQIRSVLAGYAAAGGRFSELPMPGVGHSPHIESVTEFVAALAAQLADS